MNVIKIIQKPEYFCRPRQVWHRLTRSRKVVPTLAEVTLPWGANLAARTDDNIGWDLYCYGIFDKIVPEAIARLLDRGELGVEVGANIGQNCSLMAVKSGPCGKVLAFEPHPEVFGELKANLKTWQHLKISQVQLEQVALSDEEGEAVLANGEHFHDNRGTAALRLAAEAGSGNFKVPVKRLDNYLADAPLVGVCKIDVEGNELKVLLGAVKTIERRGIRDIIFEDFSPRPSPVCKFLQARGYSIYLLHQAWLKPCLVPLPELNDDFPSGFTFNFLATTEPGRALERFRYPGWFCLLNL